MKTTFCLISLLFLFISCSQDSGLSEERFSERFQGDWKLISIKKKQPIADSIIQKYPVTIAVKDSTFLFRQATQYAGSNYRTWFFKDSVLLLPYSAEIMKNDTLYFKVLNVTDKNLTVERKNKDTPDLDTLYFEKY